MEKHMIRYIAILVLGIIVVAIPLVYFFPESAAEPVVRTSCPHDGTFAAYRCAHQNDLLLLIGYLLLILFSWLIARDKGRHQVGWPVATALMPLCFLIVIVLPYMSFRRAVINS